MRRMWISIVLLALAWPAAAQQRPTAASEWLGWLGCWELVAERQGDEPSDAEQARRTVCVEPADGGVTLVSAVDDRAVLSRTLVADGLDRLVEDNGCEGTERAWWSGDRHRLFVSATLACEAGNVRHTSGISMLTSSNRWIDIQLANVNGQREVLVRRYARAGAGSSSTDAAADLRLAATTARQAASAPLDLDDVLEAVQAVDVAAVETMLLEGRLDFQVDTRALLRLDDADAPGEVVDLLVALSYPEYFAIGTEDEAADPGGPLVVSYPAYAYGYWSGGFAPFGWGYGYYPAYGYYPPYYPPGGVYPPGGSYGGRVVNGRGYTRVRSVPTPRGDFGSWLRGAGSGGGSSVGSGSGSSSGGTMTGSGARSGGGSGTRTAKPRGGS